MHPLDSKRYIDELSYEIIGAAIRVHREMGPGLKEAVYEECMTLELKELDISYVQQFRFRPTYKGIQLQSTSVIDLLVEDQIVVELKSVTSLQKVHEAQLLNYLNLLQKPKGILLNFNCFNLTSDGKRTFVTDHYADLPDE